MKNEIREKRDLDFTSGKQSKGLCKFQVKVERPYKCSGLANSPVHYGHDRNLFGFEERTFSLVCSSDPKTKRLQKKAAFKF